MRCVPGDHRLEVLVAAPREVDQQHVAAGECRGPLHRLGNGVRAFERRQDPLGFGEPVKGRDRLDVGRRGVLDAAELAEQRMLGSDGRIVESGGDRVRRRHLAVGVLQHHRACAVEHAERAAFAGEARCMLPQSAAAAACLDADEAHRRILEKGREQADGVRAAADAGDDGIGALASGALENLALRFLADDAVEIAHHARERVGPEDRAEDVVRRAHVRHPVTHRLVDRVLERLRARGDRHDFRAEEPHPLDVRVLPAHVLLAHVDDAVEPQQGGRGRCRDAVLAGAGLGDHPLLLHRSRQQRLAEGVVDLVRAGVQQILALEKDARAAQLLRQAVGEGERRGAADEFLSSSSSSSRKRRSRDKRS
jgi:hypothetical protein